MPMGTARATLMTTITSTWLRVSIANSQLRIDATPTRHTPHKAASRQPAAGPADRNDGGDDEPPRRVDEDVADRVEHVDHEEVAERSGAADDRHAGAQVLVDPADGVVGGIGDVEPPTLREVDGREQPTGDDDDGHDRRPDGRTTCGSGVRSAPVRRLRSGARRS